MKFIYILLLSILMIACKSESTDKAETVKQSKEVTSIQQEGSTQSSFNLPSLTKELIQKIGMSCDYIDYIFYDLPISISQDNKQAIISNINFISRETVSTYSSVCKPMGRKSFQADGEIILEADIYLDKVNGCFFYVFLEDGKNTYANKISNDGINFYYNVFGQAGVKK